jgi:hypothetical protein
MEMRTIIDIRESEHKISYSDPVMFIGSCFATTIGQKFEQGKMPVMINPAGTVFNPVSVSITLESIISGKEYCSDDLFNNNGTWISFDHSTEFSSADSKELLERINKRREKATTFLAGARFLFITFGTARTYRLNKTGKPVSNCHKVPASFFRQELLSVNEITGLWFSLLDRLKKKFPDLRIIFTISPVRHWKDGAHNNQVSKSLLFLAVERLLDHSSKPSYFPAYELVMDDLRDYRFYADDMIHISPVGVDYIWDAFCRCYLDVGTLNLWRETVKITKSVHHIIEEGSSPDIQEFALNMINRIESISARYPYLDLGNEKEYFLGLLKR